MDNHTINKIRAIAITGLASIGVASAATTSGKDGMTTTTGVTQTQYTDNGLPMLAPGVQELSLGGHLNWENNTAYSFDISYGQFITSNWLIGADAGITGVNSRRDYRLGVFAEYNFLTGTKWVPFIRGNVGYLNQDQGGGSATVGVDAGIKYFMRPNLAIFASMGGDWNISNNGGGDGIVKQVDIGLKFYF